MKLIYIQAIDKNQNVVDAQMAQCDQCPGTTFRILVIHGHNHLECVECGTSFCQTGDCDHNNKENPHCKDDSCDRSHCVKCGTHMMGEHLPHGTMCESCEMVEEDALLLQRYLQ